MSAFSETKSRSCAFSFAKNATLESSAARAAVGIRPRNVETFMMK
jgi:hypothetical protein